MVIKWTSLPLVWLITSGVDHSCNTVMRTFGLAAIFYSRRSFPKPPLRPLHRVSRIRVQRNVACPPQAVYFLLLWSFCVTLLHDPICPFSTLQNYLHCSPSLMLYFRLASPFSQFCLMSSSVSPLLLLLHLTLALFPLPIVLPTASRKKTILRASTQWPEKQTWAQTESENRLKKKEMERNRAESPASTGI